MYKLYTADVWAVSLGREVRVVIVDYLDTDKKTQARKVFFSTDLSLSARDIFDIYRTRFQLEFVFRDAKQRVEKSYSTPQGTFWAYIVPPAVLRSSGIFLSFRASPPPPLILGLVPDLYI